MQAAAVRDRKYGAQAERRPKRRVAELNHCPGDSLLDGLKPFAVIVNPGEAAIY